MSSPKKSLQTPKFFWVVALVGVLVASGPDKGLSSVVRALLNRVPVVTPAVDVADLTAPQQQLLQTLRGLTLDELAQLDDFYSGLARGVAADPADEPVMPTTEALRAAHRAGLLFVWRGFLGNQPDKYPSLRPSIEGCLVEAIGEADVPINPTIKQAAVACFGKVAALCKIAKR